jgi:Histidine kinase
MPALGLFLLIAGVFACGIAFDRGTGLYAAALSSVAAIGSSIETPLQPAAVLMLLLFVLSCLLVAAFGEGLRKAFERAVAAESASAILLQELQHRTQNTLSMMASMSELQARSAKTEDLKQGLLAAAGRVRVQSEAYRHLSIWEVNRIDAHEYLIQICARDRHLRPIRNRMSSRTHSQKADYCTAAGSPISFLLWPHGASSNSTGTNFHAVNPWRLHLMER